MIELKALFCTLRLLSAHQRQNLGNKGVDSSFFEVVDSIALKKRKGH